METAEVAAAAADIVLAVRAGLTDLHTRDAFVWRKTCRRTVRSAAGSRKRRTSAEQAAPRVASSPDRAGGIRCRKVSYGGRRAETCPCYRVTLRSAGRRQGRG